MTAVTTVALPDHIRFSTQAGFFFLFCFGFFFKYLLLCYLEIYTNWKRLCALCVDSGNLKSQDSIQVKMVSSRNDLCIFSLINIVFTCENSGFRGFLPQFPQLNHVTFCLIEIRRSELLENGFWLCVVHFTFREILNTFLTW